MIPLPYSARELSEEKKKLFKASVQDLLSTLYQFNHDYFGCHSYYTDKSPHFTIGTIEDVAIDLINAYNNQSAVNLEDLDKSLDKFLRRECPNSCGRYEKT